MTWQIPRIQKLPSGTRSKGPRVALHTRRWRLLAVFLPLRPPSTLLLPSGLLSSTAGPGLGGRWAFHSLVLTPTRPAPHLVR